MKYFVRYEAQTAHDQKQAFTLGPYTIDEAITKRQEIAKLDYVGFAYIDILPTATQGQGLTP